MKIMSVLFEGVPLSTPSKRNIYSWFAICFHYRVVKRARFQVFYERYSKSQNTERLDILAGRKSTTFLKGYIQDMNTIVSTYSKKTMSLEISCYEEKLESLF